MDIKDSIISYNFDGKLKQVYKKYEIKNIINTVLNILENTSNEIALNVELFNTAMTFITDTLVFSDLSDTDKENCINVLSELNYFDIIENYLYNDFLNVKDITIHSIGKISIESNVKYLEKAFEHFFNKNPIICSKLLFEIKWLDKEKYKVFNSLLKRNKTLINSMTLSLFKNDDMVYEIMVFNIQNTLKHKDWTAELYEKSINYYKSTKERTFKNYKKIYNSIVEYE